MTDDRGILDHIEALVAEKHELRRRREDGDVDAEEERRRLAALEIELDRAWDLLRQRRARRAAGQDPESAEERSADTVEHYRS